MHTVNQLSKEIVEPRLSGLIRHFLYDQLNPDNVLTSAHVGLNECPRIAGRIKVFNSAVAMFHALSDPSSI
jgi:hypothetical protein